MWVSEIFYTVQGEGVLLGVPSVFIRTAGCNLRCEWCDTKYASWTPSGEHLSVDDIVKQVLSFKCEHIVITGGEPLIDQDLVKLTQKLHENNCHITIETAATIFLEDVICDLASLSPKLSNSKPLSLTSAWTKRHEERRWQPQIVDKWLQRYLYQLKFVVSTEGDLKEVLQMLSELSTKVPASNVVLMPQGTTAQSLLDKSKWLIEICKTHGFRYTPRMHVDIYGNRRGV